MIPEMYNPVPVCAVCGKPDPKVSFREVPAGRVRRLLGAIFGWFPRTFVCDAACLRIALKPLLDSRVAVRLPGLDMDVKP